MRIKYINEDDLNEIKVNIKPVFKGAFLERKTLEEVLNNPGIIKDTAFEIDEFQLDMSQEKGLEPLTDYENVKRVYNHMKMLSDSQASDERLWVAYTFSVFKDYMLYRWPAKSVEDLNNRYLFGYSAQRSLFRNGIARLWWIGRTTYDKTRDDPFELTRFVCQKQDCIESICGRNVFNNPDTAISVLAALNDAEKKGIAVDRERVRDVAKYMNLLAGTYLLDMFERDELYQKTMERIENH